MEQLYRVHLRKNFAFTANSRDNALAEARRVLAELLNEGWFYDADFEIIEVLTLDDDSVLS